MTKRLIGTITALMVGLGLAQPSWAISIISGPDTGTNVGVVDTIVDTEQLANSGGAELTWLQGLLPGATILPQQQSIAYYATDALNVYAFFLDPAADYFMIKNAQWHALFSNNASSAWGVFNISLLPGFNLGGDEFTISHVRSINPTTPPPPTDVPEPGSLALLGLSMLAVAAVRRRKRV